MTEVRIGNVVYTKENLPEVPARWTKGRKAAVVICVMGGLLSKASALLRYNLTPREYEEWQRIPVAKAPKFRLSRVFA